jgi:hypothetical protein
MSSQPHAILPKEAIRSDLHMLSLRPTQPELRYRRIICVNFDSDGKIRWNPVDLNIYGELPRMPANRKPRVSNRDAKPSESNVDYFLEYHSELSKKSKSGKPLWECKEKIFDWMGQKWHLGWATGWATAADMLNDNGYRGQTIGQENRHRTSNT